MSTYKDLQVYFENLATNHASILHTPEDAHFFKSDINEILSGIRDRVNFPCVIMADYDYSFVDNDSDNYHKRRAIALVFLDHCEDADDFESIRDIYSNMEEIADDWINRIFSDKTERRHPFLKDFEIDQINAVQFSTIDNSYGIWIPITATSLHDISVDTKIWSDL
jgi:hypothetical protein